MANYGRRVSQLAGRKVNMTTPKTHYPKIPPLRALRCNHCGRRLGDFQFIPGSAHRIRCPKCGQMNADKTRLNSTSVLVFFSLLNHCNGNTPEMVGEMMRAYVEVE